MPNDRRDDDDDDRPRRPRRRRDDDDDYDDDSDDRPRRRSSGDLEPAGMIVPLGVSPLSLAACYIGIIGLCLWFPAPIALVCGILALRRRKPNPGSYGSVTSDVRAWIGVVLGGIGTLLLLGVGVLFVLDRAGILK